jgi:tripartite-type tricarboxylate transporter receptor subunit TctC
MLGLLAAPSIVRAQADYPNRIIKLIVPFAAGGSTDLVARFIAERMRDRVGQTIVVENRPGANAIVGTQFAAKSAPDGYTLLLGGVSTHAINPHLRKNPPYDGIKDFTSIGLIGTGPLVVSVNPSVPVNTLAELIAYGKANPDKLAYGSSVGVILHLGGELLKSVGGFQMLHVPYSGNGPALTDVLGGRLQVMVDPVSNSGPHIATGKLRALVVPSAKRTPLLPNVPTSAEAGLPGYEVETWFGLYGPANMPADVVAKLNAALNAVLSQPDAATQFTKIGLDPKVSTPAEAAAYLKADSDKWGDVIRRIGLQAD